MGMQRRQLLLAVTCSGAAGCLSGSSDSTDSGLDRENMEKDEGGGKSNREKSTGITIYAYLIDGQSANASCITTEDDRLYDTALLAYLREKLEETPPAEWSEGTSGRPEQGFGYLSKGDDRFESIADTLESLPKSYDGLSHRAAVPCIEYEEHAIAITWSYERPE